MMNQVRQGQREEGMRPLRRARELIAVWEWTRREKEMMRGRIWTLGTGTTPGQGRAATLALLWEMATQNAISAPGPIPQLRKGRGRGLDNLLDHDNSPYPYPPSGLGRARSRNPDCLPDPPL